MPNMRLIYLVHAKLRAFFFCVCEAYAVLTQICDNRMCVCVLSARV